MEQHIFHEENHKGYTIKIVQDYDADMETVLGDPAGMFCTGKNRFPRGFEADPEGFEGFGAFRNQDELEAHLDELGIVWLPVYIYSHGMETMLGLTDKHGVETPL